MTQTFSPSEAAFSVFELAKRQPQFVLRFCILYALVVILTFAIAGGTGVGQALANYVALMSGGKMPDLERIVAAISPATAGVTILMVVSLILGIFLTAMGLRKAVRDEDTGFFGLQFGGDEIRLFLATLAVSFGVLGLIIVMGLLGGVVSFGNRGIMALAVLTAYVIAAYVALRLCQYGVVTTANRSMSFNGTWQQTKGQFWRFVGAYLLWSLVAYIAALIAQTVGTLGALAMGVKVGSGMPASLEAFMTPGWLFFTLIYGLVSGFGNLGYICIGAYAWHQMRGDLPAPKPLV
jgi:hypothetical protein